MKGGRPSVQVITQDMELAALCRAVLAELCPDAPEVVTTPVYSSGVSAVLCIWDAATIDRLPASTEFNRDQTHLFIVERRRIPGILAALPVAPIGLLLRPVNRATLTAFLEQALARCRAQAEGAAQDDSSSRNEMLQYLLQANLRLQEYDRDRTNFLARGTHDFRAPLTALSGYCGLLLEGLLGPLNDDQRDVVRRMKQSTRRLSRMASALHNLSIGPQLGKRLRLQASPIEDCVEQAVHELALSCDEKNITVSVQLTPPAETLYFDPGQIEQVLTNLIENACRFTPRNGRIEIGGYPYFWERRSRHGAPVGVERRCGQSREPNSYRIEVRDSGTAIPEELLPLIFEEYTTYSGPDDRSGVGLGLAICRTIMQSHRGCIEAAPGPEGMVFSIVIPASLVEKETHLHAAAAVADRAALPRN